jgi:hypothetical protein
MAKDLTASSNDRQNILNNRYALQQAEQHIRVDFNFAPRNYILAVRHHMDSNEVSKGCFGRVMKRIRGRRKGMGWKVS